MRRASVALTFFAVSGGMLSCRASGPPVNATPEAGYSHEAATALYRQGNYAADEALCRAAIEKIQREDPHSAKLADPLNDLAGIALRRGKFSEAKAPIEVAESVLDKSKAADAIIYARLCINKGWLRYSLGDVDAAEKIFVEGRDLLQKFQKSPSVDFAELTNNIALALEDNEDEDAAKIAQAKVMLLKGWQLRRKLTGEESAETGESLNNLGMYLLFHSEGEEDFLTAITTLKRSLAISEKVYGKDNPETAVSHTNIAMAYHLTQQDELAEPEIRLAIPMTEKFLGKENPDRSYELQVLGQIEQSQEKYKEAEANFKEAVTITEKIFGADHRFVASSLDYLESLYAANGKEAEQKAVQQRITKIRGRDI